MICIQYVLLRVCPIKYKNANVNEKSCLTDSRQCYPEMLHVFYYENTPMQYTAIFHGCENVYFQMTIFNIFLIFAPEAVLTCTHNQCFGAKIRKIVYPFQPQFYYIKVGCKGVFVTRTCFRDVLSDLHDVNDAFRCNL